MTVAPDPPAGRLARAGASGGAWRLLGGRRPSVRGRLALVYGAVFLVLGVGLLAVTYGLLHGFTSASTSVAARQASGTGGGPVYVVHGLPAPVFSNLPAVAAKGVTLPAGGGQAGIVRIVGERQARTIVSLQRTQHAADLHDLLLFSGIALVVMALVAVGLGWLVAGRVLRPLRTITDTAQQISASNLHERLAFAGPDDELKRLADTVDGLLGRLEASFEAQRRFVANASHELRTPLARQRALAEVALGDPDPTLAGLRATVERLLAAGEQQEHLIEALLTLARSDRGLERRARVDLAEVAGSVIAARTEEAAGREIHVASGLHPAPVAGDRALLERLVANLVDNGLVHNVPGGRLEVVTVQADGYGTLQVANSGPRVADGDVARLLKPFQRLAGERTGRNHGLGLSIVQAIAAAHGAALQVRPRPEGGLEVEVRLASWPPTGLPAPPAGLAPGPPADPAALG